MNPPRLPSGPGPWVPGLMFAECSRLTRDTARWREVEGSAKSPESVATLVVLRLQQNLIIRLCMCMLAAFSSVYQQGRTRIAALSTQGSRLGLLTSEGGHRSSSAGI